MSIEETRNAEQALVAELHKLLLEAAQTNSEIRDEFVQAIASRVAQLSPSAPVQPPIPASAPLELDEAAIDQLGHAVARNLKPVSTGEQPAFGKRPLISARELNWVSWMVFALGLAMLVLAGTFLFLASRGNDNTPAARSSSAQSSASSGENLSDAEVAWRKAAMQMRSEGKANARLHCGTNEPGVECQSLAEARAAWAGVPDGESGKFQPILAEVMSATNCSTSLSTDDQPTAEAYIKELNRCLASADQ